MFFFIFSIVGVIKGVITTIFGFFTFGGVQPTSLTVGGVILNAFGGALYSYVKYREKQSLVKKAGREIDVFARNANKEVQCVGEVDDKNEFVFVEVKKSWC